MHSRLDDPEWRYDITPEFLDGMNVADFVDPEVDRRLAELEVDSMLLVQYADDFITRCG